MIFGAMGVWMRGLVLSFTRKKQVVEIFYALHRKNPDHNWYSVEEKKKEQKKLNQLFSETTISRDEYPLLYFTLVFIL